MYFTSVLIFFVPAFPILWFYSRNPTRYFEQIAFLRRWISVISLHAVGIRFEVTYEEDIDWSKPFVICPNHTSILDITALTYVCPTAFSFVGKVELLKNPVTRIFFKTIDITVDRSSRVSAFKAFAAGNERLQAGKSLVIFPEGRIDDEYPPRLHQFKSGPFKLATANQVDLLPIVIHDAWKVLWDDGGLFGSKPGVIHISVLRPIKTAAGQSVGYKTFEHEVFDKMNGVWQREKSDLALASKN